jgi:site-specific DNA-methyltransferase (adenine-specific)
MDINKIHNGDCLEAMKEMKDNEFDLAIVDPPYGIERFKKCSIKDIEGATTIKSKRIAERFQKMETVNNIKPNEKYWNELFRVSKNQIIWGANNFTLPQSEYFLVWDKKQAMPNFARCELAYVSMGLKTPAKIFEYSIHKHNQVEKIHSTQKPVSLYEFCLINYAKEGDKILDTHLGSGSIAIACHNLGFDLTGYELDKEYFDNAIKRIKNHQAQLRLI